MSLFSDHFQEGSLGEQNQTDDRKQDHHQYRSHSVQVFVKEIADASGDQTAALSQGTAGLIHLLHSIRLHRRGDLRRQIAYDPGTDIQ